MKFSEISWQGDEGFYYSSYDKPKEGNILFGMTDKHKVYFHKLGTKQQKKNVFEDFIAAGEYLQSKGYTSKEYMALSGRSNGGLFVGGQQ